MDSKAGSLSAALTMNFRVRVSIMPSALVHFMVMVCSPSERLSGTLHCQEPSVSTEIWSVRVLSDSTVTVMTVSEGPWPKNSGSSVKIVSPSLMLSMVTLFEI